MTITAKNQPKTQREMITEIHTHVAYLRKDVKEIKDEQKVMKKDIEELKVNDARQDEQVKHTAGKTGGLIGAMVSGAIAAVTAIMKGIAQ